MVVKAAAVGLISDRASLRTRIGACLTRKTRESKSAIKKKKLTHSILSKAIRVVQKAQKNQ